MRRVPVAVQNAPPTLFSAVLHPKPGCTAVPQLGPSDWAGTGDPDWVYHGLPVQRASTQCSRCFVGSRRLTSLQIKPHLKMPSWSTGSASRENLVDQLPVDLIHQLPAELWARIFESIRPNSKELGDFRSNDRVRESKIAALLSDQARFHQLKLVCSRFHQVFLVHPELSAEVILAEGNASNLMPSLSLWLRRFAKFVNTVTSFDISPYQEMVLGALSCPESELSYAHLTGVSSSTIHGLAGFSLLRRCHLNASSDMPEDSLDLQPLQFLACLSDLSLAKGRFSHLSVGSQLTNLNIAGSHVQCMKGPNHASSLRSLYCDCATLLDFHEMGLSACIDLMKLALTETVFLAAMPEETLAVGSCVEFNISASMSNLTQLSRLSIELASRQPIDFCLDWVCNITSLVDLEVNVLSNCFVSDSLTLLSRLSSLKLSNLTTGRSSRLFIGGVPWVAMQALQRVELTGPFAFDDSIIQLTTLQHLSFVSFSKLYLKRGAGASSFAMLAYKLVAECPRVRVEIDREGC